MQLSNFLFATTLLFSISFSQNTKAQTVVINGQTLSAYQVRQIEQTYNIQCQSGNYWYDKKTGMVGYVGYPPFSIMQAGHNYGRLSSRASGGNTGVFLNGRELSKEEWNFWSNLNGAWIYQGYYWMDSKGNAGISGDPTVLVNFYAKAKQSQQNNYAGSGGNEYNYSNYGNSGNAWGTNNSSGNSDGSTHVISSFGEVLTMPY
jgi:hypothetical protein